MQTTRPLTNYAKKLCAVRKRNVTKPKHHPGSWGWTGMNGCLTKQLIVDDSKFSPRRTWMNELFHESMTFQLGHLIGPIDPWQGSSYVPSKNDLWSLLSWWFTIQVDPQVILWRIPRILKQQQLPSDYCLVVLMKWYKKWNIVFATVMHPSSSGIRASSTWFQKLGSHIYIGIAMIGTWKYSCLLSFPC